MIIGKDDLILVTGASGFIGTKFVERLLHHGFRNLRCFVRPGSEIAELETLQRENDRACIEIFRGNLLAAEDCDGAVAGAAIIYHLAMGRDGKSFPDAVLNSVVTTKNLLDACVHHRGLRRFVNVSSIVVYTNRHKRQGRVLDEECPIEKDATLRGAYCFAKVKQDEVVAEYGAQFGIPYVTVRPGYVLGPGKTGLVSRIGLDTFGPFLHLGGGNTIPLTYVDNCADAILLAGITEGIDGEAFNIVDDDLPSSRRFLRLYKRHVEKIRSFYVPRAVSYALCSIWEWYSKWSEGQLPPTFNRRHWHAYWKKTRYCNLKAKQRLGWTPKVSMEETCRRYFDACRSGATHA